MLKKISFLLAISLFCTSSLLAQTDKPKDPKLWTPEDIINTEYLSNPVFSPDASMVVWSKRVPVKKKDKFISNLYLTRLNVKEDGKYITTQLTQGEENDYNPVFSEDGKAIYFLSSRDKGKKLWKLSLYGGEAEEVEEFENGISSLQLKDKNTLLFTSNDGKTLYDQQAEERKDDVEVIEDSLHWQPSHIYSFDLDKKQTTRITSNEKPIGSFKVSHNGDWLYYTMTRSLSYGADAQKDPYSYLINLNTTAYKKLLFLFFLWSNLN